MDLQKSTDEVLDEICRLVYEKLYGTGAKGIEHFIAGIGEELTERNIQHSTSKKWLDKHRDKYFKVKYVWTIIITLSVKYSSGF